MNWIKKLFPSKELQYFELSEFASPDEPGSGAKMDKDFVIKLDDARALAGIPFVVKPPNGSGYRTQKHNREVGGVEDSAHTKALAVDIRVVNSEARYKILNALMMVGFNRIGIGQNFIHVDDDKDKPQNAVWTYSKRATR